MEPPFLLGQNGSQQRGHKFREKKAKSEFLLHHHLKRIEARTEFRYASFNLSYAPRSSHRRRRRRHQLQHQLQHQLHPLPRSSRPSLPHPRRRRRPLHGPPARSAQQSEIACERCKRSGLANGARRRDPRLGRAPLRRARKVAWAAARSSSSPRLAQSRPRRGRGWQALVVVAGPRRTSGARGARWQGMQAGGPGQAGRQAGRRLRAERRAHAPLPTAAAVGGGWVARQAAPYSALNDWHGLFCCRPRFPRLRAVLAVARTARACCCARRLLPHASWHARRGDGGGGGGGGGSRERARVQGGCKASRGAARSGRWFMENSDIVCAAAWIARGDNLVIGSVGCCGEGTLVSLKCDTNGYFFVFNKKALLTRYFHRSAERPSLFARA